MVKIKGVLPIKMGAYWFPESEAKIKGLKRLVRSTENMVQIAGKVENGEIHIENAYFDEEKKKIFVEIDCK